MEDGIERVEKNDYIIEEDDYERQGTVWTATAHVITAVIGSGVLALAWSVAQLGWIVGPIVLIAFASITYYTSTLMADCYRFPDPMTGSRNRTYMSAVQSYLGPENVRLCFIAQYTNLWGALVSYTITSATSMRAILQSNCFHKYGSKASCKGSGNSFIIIFGALQILLSQIPNLEKITWLSVVAAVMSFGYSFISLFLSIAKSVSHGHPDGTILGVIARDHHVSSEDKTWRILQALGNVAFAFSYAEVLIEIQDTLKSPPSENKTMKRASLYGVGTTTVFYIAIGCIGYAAFGDDVPGNILTGFQDPFWLVDIANICIIIHLVGAYQVYAQPIFATVERKINSMLPNSTFTQNILTLRMPFTKHKSLRLTPSKLISRSVLIISSTFVAMLLPFFNAVMGFLGAVSFWPLTVYFPINMFLVQRKIKRGSITWVLLQSLSLICLLISIAATIGSIAGIIDSLKSVKLFKAEY